MNQNIEHHKMIINGQFVDSLNGQNIEIESPSSKEIFASVIGTPAWRTDEKLIA